MRVHAEDVIVPRHVSPPVEGRGCIGQQKSGVDGVADIILDGGLGDLTAIRPDAGLPATEEHPVVPTRPGLEPSGISGGRKQDRSRKRRLEGAADVVDYACVGDDRVGVHVARGRDCPLDRRGSRPERARLGGRGEIGDPEHVLADPRGCDAVRVTYSVPPPEGVARRTELPLAIIW